MSHSAAHKIFLLLFAPTNRVYTKFGIDPRSRPQYVICTFKSLDTFEGAYHTDLLLFFSDIYFETPDYLIYITHRKHRQSVNSVFTVWANNISARCLC